ncbi:MAG: hypothetical protein AAFR96_04295 [Planctomycetota bacterium]
MTTFETNRIRPAAVDEVTLSSPALRLRTAPQLGGKLVELRSVKTGRDWLWRNPRHELRQGKPLADYVGEFDSGGWDELFPNVAPVPAGIDMGPWGSGGLTDHGELWYRLWQTEASGGRSCTQTAASLTDEFRFGRTIRLDPQRAAASLSYELTNLGHEAMPFVWAAHPLFRCEPGMSLQIDGHLEVEAVHCAGKRFEGVPTSCLWQDLVERFPFIDNASGWSPDDLRCGLTFKAFVRTDRGQAVSLLDRTSGERLSLGHSGGPVTHTAIWLNFGGWSGDNGERLCNIGIEPTTFPGDEPPRVPHPSARLLPGETRQWELGLSIDPA